MPREPRVQDQQFLPLEDKPDHELSAAELARLIRDLGAQIAPVQARLRKLRALHASKVGADKSRRVRAATKAKRDDDIRAAAEPMLVAGEKGVTAKLARKFKRTRRTIQRALKDV